MGPIEMEKFQAMKRNASRQHQLASLLQRSLKASLLGLILLSTATWIPQVCSCLRSFFLVSVPYAASIAIAPKCLFIVSNIIVVFLVSESKLSGTSSESMDVYDEYVARNHMLRRLAGGEVKREEKEEEEEVQTMLQTIKEKDVEVVQESKEEQEDEVAVHEGMESDQCEEKDVAVLVEENKEEVQEEQEIEEEETERECEEEKELDGEEEAGLAAEELNRRVEDFIAKFNMERRMEARMLVCCC